MDILSMVRLGKSLPKKIAVFRALQLGDLLCAVPAFRALRRAFPNSKITLIGLPWAKSFMDRFPNYFDDFLEFPGYPGLPEIVPQVKKIPTFFKTAQERRFDLAIQMHGSGIFANPITVMLGANVNAGFFLYREYCPDTYRFMLYPTSEHEIWRYLRLIEFLGIPIQGDHLEFPLFQKDERDFSSLDKIAHLQAHEYICIHPGARLPSRRWLIERFARVADALAISGLKIVLTGSADEIQLNETVGANMKVPFINLAGQTNLGTLAILLKKARLLICNDTGVSHIAAALRVPSIVIVAGSDPSRWAPLDYQRHRIVYHHIDCRPCFFSTCPVGYPCANGVSAETVISQAKKLLQQNLHVKKEGVLNAPVTDINLACTR